ncbi:MAG: phosphatase PAP2 family protein [Verrucomicrobia bacterium]|nr:phosphatase PAP2 family protein [Verrucomicrobiota bacterium]
MKIFNLEMEWIHQLQDTLRSNLLDWFFIGWHYIDTIFFTMLVIVAVWALFDRKIGIKMTYIFILSYVMNKFLKVTFGLPRPCQLDPSVAVWVCFYKFGFPSAAAQSATIYLGLVLIEFKKRIHWVWGALFAFFLCFSRIYLGLHFFHDILGGIAVGAFLVLIYWKIFPKLEPYWRWGVIFFPFLILPVIIHSAPIFFWLSLGVAVGLLLPQQSLKNKRAHFISLLIGVVLFMLGITHFPKWTAPFALIMGFWVSFLGSYCAKTLLSRKWI